jgi:hypothetical protein
MNIRNIGIVGNGSSGLSSFVMAAMLSASIGQMNAPVFRKDEEKETVEQRQERERIHAEQELLRRNNRLSASHGLTKFIFNGVEVWALNERNAARKYAKLC